MDVALGLRAHAGWAALVALGRDDGALALVDRGRIALIDPGEEHWARQPYHAAHGLDRNAAHDVVRRGIDSAHRVALREVARVVQHAAARERRVCACGVVVGAALPAWSTDDILAVEFRMQQAEGALFPAALLYAAEACDLAAVAIPKNRLLEQAMDALHLGGAAIDAAIGALGRSAGRPWASDQKAAALAAWIALARTGS